MSQDFGEAKKIIGRKVHRCEYCYGPIPKGELHWNYRGKYDGEWQNWRMHDECFNDYDDDGYGEFIPGSAPYPPRIEALMEAGRWRKMEQCDWASVMRLIEAWYRRQL